ncbi:MAG: hypothetical protein P8R04_05340 [Gammaproteobacteria bacterium]|nr:hypothetical protein [Gammaproteobacteria bacterium]
MKKSTLKNKTLPWVTAVIAAFISLNASAIIIETHDGLEVKASAVTLPNTDSGRVSVRPCDQCNPLRLNLDRDTTLYEIRSADGQASLVNLQQFAAEMRLIGNSNALVLIIYQLDNKTISQARLYSEASPSSQGGSNAKQKPGKKNPSTARQRG